MHTGEAEERDGDYFGPALNRAGSPDGVWPTGGQVLVSLAAAEVVRDLLAGRVWALIELGRAGAAVVSLS